MSQHYFILIIIALFSAAVMASGKREIAIADCLDQQCEVVKFSHLDKDLFYLGSTDSWHLFAKVLTSSNKNSDGSEAMPFDNVYGYKLAINEATLVDIYNLTEQDLKSTAMIRECPPVVALDEKTKSISVAKVTDSCLFR